MDDERDEDLLRKVYRTQQESDAAEEEYRVTKAEMYEAIYDAYLEGWTEEEIAAEVQHGIGYVRAAIGNKGKT